MASGTNLRGRLERAQHFFSTEVWEVRLDQLPKRQALRYRAARIAYCAAQGMFFSDTLHVRAAALTYFTVLSLVPLLAFIFAILKGFGAYDALVERTLRPYVLATFEGNEALQRAFDQILDFVQGTGVASLGVFGLLTLLYAATRLLHNVEEALNHIWNVPAGRSPLRQLTDYAAIIMVTPLCLLLAAGLGTVSQLVDVLKSVEERLGMGGFLDWSMAVLGPFAVILLGLLFLYVVMPNTSVNVRSALVGAAVGGVLWYAMLIVHVRFQVGVARFNALYSSFGVIPIFLVWVYVSWLAVMVGAQVAATSQKERSQTQRMREAASDQDYREAVGLSALLRIAQAFVRGEAAPGLSALGAELDVSEQLLDDLLRRVERAGLVVRAGEADGKRFVLARMPESISVKDVLDALRKGGSEDAPERALEALPGLGSVAVQTLHALDAELERSRHNKPLLELLQASLPDRPRSARASTAPHQPPPPGSAE